MPDVGDGRELEEARRYMHARVDAALLADEDEPGGDALPSLVLSVLAELEETAKDADASHWDLAGRLQEESTAALELARLEELRKAAANMAALTGIYTGAVKGTNQGQRDLEIANVIAQSPDVVALDGEIAAARRRAAAARAAWECAAGRVKTTLARLDAVGHKAALLSAALTRTGFVL